MSGRKTVAATPYMAKVVSFERALPTEGNLQCLGDEHRVDERFSGKQSRLAFVFVASNQTQPIESCSDCDAAIQSGIRNLLADALLIWLCHLSRHVAIGCNQR